VPVALVDPDSESRALYGQSLGRVNMEVEQFDTLLELLNQINQKSYRVIIINPIKKELPHIAKLKTLTPQIPLITISRMMAESQLDVIMKLGVTMHINRDLTRPRDLLVAIEQIISSNNLRN
jgi:DNA-binding NtrC family response regulator